MLAALIAREGTVTGLLIVIAHVLSALALLSRLAAAGAFKWGGRFLAGRWC